MEKGNVNTIHLKKLGFSLFSAKFVHIGPIVIDKKSFHTDGQWAQNDKKISVKSSTQVNKKLISKIQYLYPSQKKECLSMGLNSLFK